MRGRNITPGDPCAGTCGRPMRPTKWHPDELPGSVAHKARGLCGKCYHVIHRGQYDPDAPIVVYGLEHPELRDTARGLLDWVTARRKRGIPTKGVSV